jgi:hypothetical protein
MTIPTEDTLRDIGLALEVLAARLEDAAVDADIEAIDAARAEDAARAIPAARLSDALWRLGAQARRAAVELDDLAASAAKIPAHRGAAPRR